MRNLVIRLFVYGWIGWVMILNGALFMALDARNQLLTMNYQFREIQAELYIAEADFIIDLKKAGIKIDYRPTQQIEGLKASILTETEID